MSVISKVKGTLQNLFIELPKAMKAFALDFRRGLPLARSHPMTLSRQDFQRVSYTVRQFQKVGGYILVACLPVVGSPIGIVGLMYPRNMLTYHFWRRDQEASYLSLEYKELCVAADELRCLANDTLQLQSLELEDLRGETLHTLATATGVRMFGSATATKMFPRSFLQRWLEIKCRDTATDDQLIRRMLVSVNIEEETMDNDDDDSEYDGLLWRLPGDSMSDEEVVRACAQRCMDPSLTVSQLRAQLVRWVTSMESMVSYPPPALTPNRIERASTKVWMTARMLGIAKNEQPVQYDNDPANIGTRHRRAAAAPATSTSASTRNDRDIMTSLPSLRESLGHFVDFSLRPLTSGPSVVYAYEQAFRLKEDPKHATYLLNLVRLNHRMRSATSTHQE